MNVHKVNIEKILAEDPRYVSQTAFYDVYPFRLVFKHKWAFFFIPSMRTGVSVSQQTS